MQERTRVMGRDPLTFNRLGPAWIWVASGAAIAGLGLGYRDLLAAAFTANPITDKTPSVERGRALRNLDCAACHGERGRGDGPASAALHKRPKDLTRIARPPVFPDGVLAYRIANGGDVMPAWKNVLSGRNLWDLVNFIRAQRTGSIP